MGRHDPGPRPPHPRGGGRVTREMELDVAQSGPNTERVALRVQADR
ncbi:MAG: hypothetical protein QOG43_1219 [Actinomycetota bacterium]|nr:hypothetical protein [Actinomycetota bacterium]